MKVKELIQKLQSLPNQEAEVIVQHWVLLKKSDKVVVNMSKPTKILVPADGSNHTVMIDTEKIEEDL